MDKKELNEIALLQSMSDITHWNSWGSPMGLSVMLLGLSLSLVAVGVFLTLLHVARII